MKVSVISESPADEAAIRILIEGMLGRQIQLVSPVAVRSSGIDGAQKILSPTLMQLHYHTDAEALVFVIDSDRTPVHQVTHEQSGGEDKECRLCRLRQTVARIQNGLRPRSQYPPLKIALGLAVPAIEA